MDVVPVVPEEQRDSNTRISPARHWIFTLNNPNELDSAIWKNMGSSGSMKWVCQLEVGEEGTPHLQGYVDFGRKVRPKSLFHDRYHWEKCKHIKASIEYCSKAETRVAGPWACGINIPEQFLLHELRPWQSLLMADLVIQPDDRKVRWYVDKIGGKGKTAICRHICAVYKNRALYVGGKAADIKYAVAEFLKEKQLWVVMLDFTRSVENFISYEAIESIKNGIIFSTKYESGMHLFRPPHVICFSNWQPDLSKLSEDRWDLMDLDLDALEIALDYLGL